MAYLAYHDGFEFYVCCGYPEIIYFLLLHRVLLYEYATMYLSTYCWTFGGFNGKELIVLQGVQRVEKIEGDFKLGKIWKYGQKAYSGSSTKTISKYLTSVNLNQNKLPNILTRMAEIKTSGNTYCWQGCRAKKILMLCVG